MNYYHISFNYKGPRGGIAPGPRSEEALTGACGEVGACLTRLGLEHEPSYAWPDGSLYEYVRSDKFFLEVMEMIDKDLLEHAAGVRVDVEGTGQMSPDDNPWKVGYKTVEEYFGADKLT